LAEKSNEVEFTFNSQKLADLKKNSNQLRDKINSEVVSPSGDHVLELTNQ